MSLTEKTPTPALADPLNFLSKVKPTATPSTALAGRTVAQIASTVYAKEGVNTYILKLVGMLAARNAGLTQLVVYEYGESDHVDTIHIGDSTIIFMSFQVNRPEDLLRVLAKFQYMEARPLDLIVAQIPFFPEARAASEYAHNSNIAFVAYNHAGPGSLNADEEGVLMETLSLNPATRVLAVSEASRDKIGKESKLDVSVEIVGQMIATECFEPLQLNDRAVVTKIGTLRKHLKADGKKDLLLLAPNTLIPRKRPLDLLRALKSLIGIKRLENLRLAFVGHMGFPESAELLQEATAYVEFHNLGRHVTFSEPVDQDTLRYLYAAADLIAMPGDKETFGLVLAEAGLMERPVIGYDVPGVREVIAHGQTGLLVPWDDDTEVRIGALANAIRTLCLDPTRRTAMGRAGRRHVRARFDPWHLIGRHEEIYAQAIESNRCCER